jgi:hypothetical protein
MDYVIIAGDVDAGDLIVLPDAVDPVVVNLRKYGRTPAPQDDLG